MSIRDQIKAGINQAVEPGDHNLAEKVTIDRRDGTTLSDVNVTITRKSIEGDEMFNSDSETLEATMLSLDKDYPEPDRHERITCSDGEKWSVESIAERLTDATITNLSRKVFQS